MPKPPRVLITGVGLVTPLGADRESSWQGLLNGERAIRRLSHDEPYWPTDSAGAPAIASDRARQIAESSDDAELSWLLHEPAITHAVAASFEAAEHAALDWHQIDPTRSACVIGTSKGGVHSWFEALRSRSILQSRNGGSGTTLRNLEPTTPCAASDVLDERRRLEELATRFATSQEEFPAASWIRLAANGPASVVASLLNLQGGALAPVTACATGLSSILRGADLIRSGECDVVLAGSSDASLTPTVLASFRKLGVLANRDIDPAKSVMAYDRNRTGFLIGEGSGIVVLESEAHSTARGAKPIAEWLTGGMACEASGLTTLEEEPEALTWLIRDVLRRSEVAPGEIDYISLHGTATKANDLAEVRAIKAAFGPAAYELSASSLKGAIGHLLGAAGSVEFATTLLAMRDSQLPPTMNLTDPDDECDLDFVAGKSKPREVTHAMKLSLGFGGHLVAGVIRKM
jgi:3-oxoacyl-[acyl-carrier-protein] synthase II